MPATDPRPPLAPIPDPGAYLQRRREVAGLTREQVADRLAALPWAIAPASSAQREALARRIATAELDGQHFNDPQAALLRQIVPFDVWSYQALVHLDVAGAGWGLPVPHLCRACGCSFNDPCTGADGTCAWVEDDPTLCTACPPTPAATLAAEPELAS